MWVPPSQFVNLCGFDSCWAGILNTFLLPRPIATLGKMELQKTTTTIYIQCRDHCWAITCEIVKGAATKTVIESNLL